MGCMAENKCEKSCQSMGAFQYRWFQNGCCECVGHHCKNYGINEPKCLECGDDEDDELSEDELTDEELDQLIAEEESNIQNCKKSCKLVHFCHAKFLWI